MKVVVGRQVPEHRLPLNVNVIPQEEIVGFLTLSIEERVVVIAPEALDHVSRMTAPLVDLPIRRHCIDKVGSTILNGYHVPMCVIPVYSRISQPHGRDERVGMDYMLDSTETTSVPKSTVSSAMTPSACS